MDAGNRNDFIMQDTCNFLAADLKSLFERGEITTSRYAENIQFEDPISKYDTRDGYLFNIRLLRTFFNITFDLHSIRVSGPDTVTATWTMVMQFWLLPWKPELTFTGRTDYTVDPATGTILSHRDYWDALQRNAFLSLEGLQHVLQMFMQVQLTPAIETPRYMVLKRYKEYEIRKYEPYLVAETAMSPGAGPASGAGFNDLAGYIFGGNQQKMSMEMTTPVFTRVEPGNASVSMQFVMEGRYGDVASLPEPANPRVTRKAEEPRYVAAIRFSGWPLDFEVVQNERSLRDMLLRDGHRPLPGYNLARYNEPTVPPFLRRNEVLVQLAAFPWPAAGQQEQEL